jgi:hypothetical protein
MTASIVTDERDFILHGKDGIIAAEDFDRLVDLMQAAFDKGNKDEYYRLMGTLPLNPKIGLALKDWMGSEALSRSDFDLTECEYQLGKEWLAI